MELTKVMLWTLLISAVVTVSMAQNKFRNPFIMRERRHCERLAVYEMRRVSDPMIRRPVPRRVSGSLIRRPIRGPVLRDSRLPLNLRFSNRQAGPRHPNLPPLPRHPNSPSHQRPSSLPFNPRQVRVKRQTKNKSPPSKPVPPTSITLPDQGTGVLPSMINLPQTGLGARRSMDKVEGPEVNSVSIPLIPSNQPISVLLPKGPLSPGTNQPTQDKILNIPENRMGVFRLVDVPGNPSKVRAPILRHPTLSPYTRVSCLTQGHVCGFERERSCRQPPCETTPACFLPRGPANKPGKCPTFITKYLTEIFSLRYCFDDSNCARTQICCHGNGLLAGSACVNPIFDAPRNATRIVIT